MSMKYISPSDSEPLPTNWVLQTLRRNSSPIPTPRPKSTFQDHATKSDDTHEQELPHIGYISTRYGTVILSTAMHFTTPFYFQ